MPTERKTKRAADNQPELPAGAIYETDHLQARAEEMRQYNAELEAAGVGRTGVVSGGGPGAAPGGAGTTAGTGTSSGNTVGGAGGAGTAGTGGAGTTTT